jgi:glycosyltransferase involved in cell wall biosynthesis
MKRALVITYDFPPCLAPGAALRTAKLVQYLPEYGWEALVVCRKESLPEPQETRSRVIRIPTGVPPRISYQLGAWAWASRIFPGVRGLIRESQPDLLYASGPPFAHALTAVRLGKEFGLPVVVDFRDAWSLDPHLSGGPVKQTIKSGFCRYIYPRLERLVMEGAAAIVTNTPSTQRSYARAYPNEAPKLHLIPNGFDEPDFSGAVTVPVRDKPLLLYCGRFSGVGARSPELLLRGLRGAIDQGVPLELEVLGDDSAMLQECIAQCGLAAHVRIRASVPHREAIRAMREADVLVVYQKPSRNGITPIAGKTFEYLRAGRPVLAVVPPGDNADVVRSHAPIHAVVTREDPQAVTEAVVDLLRRARRSTESTFDPEFAERYSRRSIAAQIAGVMDGLIGRSQVHAAMARTS